MTINHALFASDPKPNGMNFKMIFKVRNVRDYDAQIAHCYADGVGIRMYAHESRFSSSGVAVSVRKADGGKCERCWMYSEQLGADPDFPGLCPRCAAVMKALGAAGE